MQVIDVIRQFRSCSLTADAAAESRRDERPQYTYSVGN
jgi:hypothetical protein